MASKTDIVNKALRLCGSEPVTAITDDTPEAKSARAFYDETKQAALEYGPWSFAQKRVSIAKDATAPAWGYESRFKLPQDWLQIHEIEGVYPLADFRVEGEYLLVDGIETLNLVYTADVTEGLFSGLFVEALAAALAANMAPDLVESNTRQQTLEGLAMQRMQEADNKDSRNRSNKRTRTEGYLRRSRYTMGTPGLRNII